MTWTQWGFNALSVPNGSDASWIDYEWDNLELFDTIYLSFDNDPAGKENRDKAMSRLGIHRCKIINLPFKDANEALIQGSTQEQARQWFELAENPQFKGLMSAVEWKDATIEEFFPDPKKPKGFLHPLLQSYDGGIEFLKGDVTIWSGISSHGKTTFLLFLASDLVNSGHKIMKVSLEMKPAKIISRMFKAMQGKPTLSKGQIEALFLWTDGAIYFADKMGCIDQAPLFDMMQFAYARHGVDHFFIDSFMRVSGLEEDYPAQGAFLNKLQEFSKSTDTHVHLVAHPRKTMDGMAPGRQDVKGSSLLLNNCDNLLMIHRNTEKEKLRRERPITDSEDLQMHDAEIISEKQRDNGWTGRIPMRFSPITFRFSKFP